MPGSIFKIVPNSRLFISWVKPYNIGIISKVSGYHNQIITEEDIKVSLSVDAPEPYTDELYTVNPSFSYVNMKPVNADVNLILFNETTDVNLMFGISGQKNYQF